MTKTRAIILRLIKQYKWRLMLGFAALIMVDLLQLYVPRVLKAATDGLALGGVDETWLLKQGAIILGLAGGMALMRVLWRPLLLGFSRVVERELRGAMFNHLQNLHVGYLASQSTGEMMARATNDLTNIRMATGIGMVAGMDGLVLTVFSLGFMFYINPTLAALALLPMPLTAFTTRYLSRQMHRRFMAGQEAFAEMTEEVREVLSGIRLVKGFALMEPAYRNLSASGRRYVDINMSIARITGLFFPAMTYFTNLSMAVVLGLGGGLAVLSEITPGDFVAFYAYLGLLAWPMMALGWVVGLSNRARVSLKRVEEVLSADPAIKDPQTPRRLSSSASKGVSIKGLDFTYPLESTPALSGVTLDAAPGSTTALVGPIGSGKSTVLGLLGRLYDPPPGTVLVEGVDIRELAAKDLRNHVVQVPQEAFIFSASIRENLDLSGAGYSEDAMWRALSDAELADDVRALENGLDTKLGERAHNLSGGQRQRLALARALIQNPHILALDDPLSAVDTETEGRILKNLARLRKGRTTLIISHRLASIAFADDIYVFNKGRIVEKGGHDDLMLVKGLYRELFSEQAMLAGLDRGDSHAAS